uniref:DUF4456 domain-containing protein n=2 Tax=Schistosoma mansoni TaxID=6183 RepID=A0A5K4F1Y5_SCHMA
MNQSSNKRQSERACCKSDGKSAGRFEEIERKIEKIEEKLSFESNKQTETELTLRKLIDQVELMKLNASNLMQTSKPISVKRQGCRKTSLTTFGVPYSQNGDQMSNPGAFTCSDESSSDNLPNLLKSERTPNVVYTYTDNYLKACMSNVEKKLFGKLDICLNKIQSLEAHANQNKTEDDNRPTNSEETPISQEENSSEMSVYSEYQVYFTVVAVRMSDIYMNTVNQYFNRPTSALDLRYHYFICQGLGSHIALLNVMVHVAHSLVHELVKLTPEFAAFITHVLLSSFDNVTLEEHKRRLEEMEKLVKHFDSPIVNETIKSVLSSDIKSRHQQNRQLQKLYNRIIEKFLGIIDKWQPNLNNLEINSNSDTGDLNGSNRSVNESESNNSKLSQLLLLLHKDIIHLQTKLENQPIKYDETSIVKNAQKPLDFRTLAESILVVKINLELKINKLESQLNLERDKIHTEVGKLKEICDRFKTRGDT